MAHSDEALRRYYDQRASVYDDMYLRRDPMWRKDLESLADEMAEALSGRSVLEVACGTGFWTEIVAKTAKRVVAVDSSEKMLELARKRKKRSAIVEYVHCDAYSLEEISSKFDAGLANFWFSHVPKSRIEEFLCGFHNRLERSAIVFMADNRYVPGIGGQLITKLGIEDTFKLRECSDGSKHEVLKNYYDRDALEQLFTSQASDLKIHEMQYFWSVQYMVT
jgi:2-polyprenyl-3-methyl-5-hydroxy-6-metoxy-1,4-benzoquinol methylase